MKMSSALFLAVGLATATVAGAQQPSKSVSQNAAELAKSPLKDLNVEQDAIPPVLQEAVKRPYTMAGIKTCADITATVNGLDSVLGRDVDAPLPKGKSSDDATELAMAAGQSAIGSLIPGRGLVRQISGAAAAEKKAKAAVFAGAVRRGYLKGIGLARGCKPPAAPAGGAAK
jgi:hypothetical protein